MHSPRLLAELIGRVELRDFKEITEVLSAHILHCRERDDEAPLSRHVPGGTAHMPVEKALHPWKLDRFGAQFVQSHDEGPVT
ncbi:hypothetical protein, partial [Streptomyces sp. NPDC057386]|uniref:hypothetical protein n=1 Tax=Streptomyces sp. NPDC057386 TaxID=3346114 RepID=UPI00363B4813